MNDPLTERERKLVAEAVYWRLEFELKLGVLKSRVPTRDKIRETIAHMLQQLVLPTPPDSELADTVLMVVERSGWTW